MKNCKIKTSFVSPDGFYFIFIFVPIVINTMIFQYDRDPVLIQRILIGFFLKPYWKHYDEKTKMTTSISSKAQKIMDANTDIQI